MKKILGFEINNDIVIILFVICLITLLPFTCKREKHNSIKPIQLEQKPKLSEDTLLLNGTVTFIGLEGGFYGIISDDGNHYDPINLPQELKKDGLRIKCKCKTRNDLVSYHMWGAIIEIIDINIIK